MSGIVSGVNVITEFETPESASYSGYIDYMNKEQGKQEQYKEYNDYLAKTDSLFTMEKDNLSEDEIKELKSLFEKAQENGSVLWKTVISFDNRWLEQNGIYDMKSGILNETKMREAIRKGVNRMLDNEGLQHALWSAGIHYDTDNIHVHVATVELLKIQTAQYMATYGDTGKDYGTGKLEDLHKRLGNIILAEMRTFALEEKENEREEFGGREIENVFPVELEEIEEASLEEEVYSKWTKEYKEARKSFYGSALEEPDEERGIRLYEQEAENGNVLALFDLAEIYKNGNTEEKEKSAVYYQRAVKGWNVLAEKENLTNHQKGTILYKLGKCYDRGYGVERDADQAKKYYQSAENKGNNYAAYSLGNLFYYQEKDQEAAYEHYRKGVSDQYRKNPFGDYQFAVLSQEGIGGKEGAIQAERYFEQALNGFIKLDEDINDPKLEYRMGYMFYQGIGTEQDTEKALGYLKKATVKGHAYVYLETDQERGYISVVKEFENKESLEQYICNRFTIIANASRDSNSKEEMAVRFVQQKYKYSEKQSRRMVAQIAKHKEIFEEFFNYARVGRFCKDVSRAGCNFH